MLHQAFEELKEVQEDELEIIYTKIEELNKRLKKLGG